MFTNGVTSAFGSAAVLFLCFESPEEVETLRQRADDREFEVARGLWLDDHRAVRGEERHRQLPVHRCNRGDIEAMRVSRNGGKSRRARSWR